MPAQRIACPSLMVRSLPAAAKPVPISLPTPKNIGGEITHWVIVDRGWASDLFDEGSVERVWMELKPRAAECQSNARAE